MEPRPLYKPSYATPIKELPFIQRRIGLMGRSGSGKTYGALTFKNPVVIDIDGNLAAHSEREDVLVLRFNDETWIREKLGYKFESKIKYPIRDAVKKYLLEEATKLSEQQTLVIDSWTSLQVAFDLQKELEPKYVVGGGIDAFDFWACKIDYSEAVLSSLQKLRCDVVVTLHEQDQREHLGKLNGKIEPLMEGKFNKKIGLYFTEFYRCIVESKLDKDKKLIGANYLWQTASSSDVSDLKTRMAECPILIPAHSKHINYPKYKEVV